MRKDPGGLGTDFLAAVEETAVPLAPFSLLFLLFSSLDWQVERWSKRGVPVASAGQSNKPAERKRRLRASGQDQAMKPCAYADTSVLGPELSERHGVRSVVVSDGIIGCPHEEGADYPEGQICPQCPFWANRDRWTGL